MTTVYIYSVVHLHILSMWLYAHVCIYSCWRVNNVSIPYLYYITHTLYYIINSARARGILCKLIGRMRLSVSKIYLQIGTRLYVSILYNHLASDYKMYLCTIRHSLYLCASLQMPYGVVSTVALLRAYLQTRCSIVFPVACLVGTPV